MRLLCTSVFLVFFVHVVHSQTARRYSAIVLDSLNHQPISGAHITDISSGNWATTDDKGYFSISSRSSEKLVLAIKGLNYVGKTVTLDKIGNNIIYLVEKTLGIEEVSVLARSGTDLSTSYRINREALDHLQAISLSDIQQLLPGGKTNVRQHLAEDRAMEFRINNGTGNDGSGELGNPFHGIAIISDGYQFSTNTRAKGSMGQGIDTRSIPLGNIESVEVVTGVPSAEYGDLNEGMVSITTKTGRTKYLLEYVTKPNIKQTTLSKGFDLGEKRGTVNLDFQRSHSFSEIESPYTTYDKNTLSVKYAKSTGLFGRFFDYSLKLEGNLGGYNNESDPDMSSSTYLKVRDHYVGMTYNSKWLLKSKWITNLEHTAGIFYSNNLTESVGNKSSSSTVPAVHSMRNGYFVAELYEKNPSAGVVLIPPGNWYEKNFRDNQPLNFSFKSKATLNHHLFDNSHDVLSYGIEYRGSGNLGKGTYYGDYAYAKDGWRPYVYSDEPFLHSISLFAQENVNVPLGRWRLNVRPGLRHDMTYINQSVYGFVQALSPRLNMQLHVKNDPKSDDFIRTLNFGYSFGKARKLPSANWLYPVPSYMDRLAFAPPTNSKGETYYAYHTTIRSIEYNPDLRWQTNVQHEFSLNAATKFADLRLSFSMNNVHDSYQSFSNYERNAYNFTGPEALNGVIIPELERHYDINELTGIVTVRDVNNIFPSQVLPYTTREYFIPSPTIVNGLTIYRHTMRMNLNFKPIKAIHTRFVVDGSWHVYSGFDDMEQGYTPGDLILMNDRRPYRYLAFFYGGRSSDNGGKSNRMDFNVSTETRIPKLKLIFTARLEATLVNKNRRVTRYADGSPRGYSIANRADYLPTLPDRNPNDGGQYAIIYPEYYITYDDPDTKIPFYEKFLWASENDPVLFSDLSRLIGRTNTNYMFDVAGTSAYYIVNFGISKDIGKIARISFNATNFNNTTATYESLQTGRSNSLYQSTTIPEVYYGLSLSLKL